MLQTVVGLKQNFVIFVEKRVILAEGVPGRSHRNLLNVPVNQAPRVVIKQDSPLLNLVRKAYNQRKHMVEEYESYESGSDKESIWALNHVGSNREAILVKVNIEGKEIPLELDTGSNVSIMPSYMYNEQFCHLELEHTSAEFEGYFGAVREAQGKISVNVHYEDHDYVLPMYVLDSSGPALFGRNWLKHVRLNWKEVLKSYNPVNKVEAKPGTPLQAVLDKHKPVFGKDLGLLKGNKAKLNIDPHANPKFMKARPEPYALKPKIKASLNHLVDEGIITPVSTSEWATPIVPIVKSNGSIRICGDFKVTLNPVLSDDKYPLPRIEDIFASLAGGQHFSKIDLASAYLQMELDDNSKDYLTINTSLGLFRYNRLPFGIKTAPALWQRSIDTVLQGLPNV